MTLLYLDYAATAPITAAVVDAMRPWLQGPGRAGVAGDVAAAAGIDDPGQVWLCSGGSAANNAALAGLQAAAAAEGRPAVASQPTEHPSVLAALRALEARGVELHWLPIDADGVVTDFEVPAQVGVVSVMLGNNETGVLQPSAWVAAARAAGLRVHVDAVQAARWRDVRPAALGADLVSVSAHKLGGPKGAAALWGPGVACLPPSPGLAQAVVAGFAAALAEPAPLAVAASRDALQADLLQAVPGSAVNGATAERLPGHLSVTVEGVSGEAVVLDLDQAGIAISAGSACSTGEPGPSHVMLALGRSVAAASGSLRFSLGEPLSPAARARVVAAVSTSVERLRAIGC